MTERERSPYDLKAEDLELFFRSFEQICLLAKERNIAKETLLGIMAGFLEILMLNVSLQEIIDRVKIRDITDAQVKEVIKNLSNTKGAIYPSIFRRINDDPNIN